MIPTPRPVRDEATAPSTDADALIADGRLLDAIDVLHRANRLTPDPDTECRLAVLRNQAFDTIEPSSRFERWPAPRAEDAADPGSAPGRDPVAIPVLDREGLDGDAVRGAIGRRGAAHVPGLLDAGHVHDFVEGIDHVLALREGNRDTPYRTHSSWFAGLPLDREAAQTLGRPWIAGAGGVLACDSPRLLELLFATYEDVGLRDVIEDYLGERPVLSANKCTLRRVPTTANTDWHQDGAFLGTGVRALNVWVALTDCGIDAPGLDLVPRRFEQVQETGTGGAIFDWAVGPDVVTDLVVDAPVVRPTFRAGDALLFDDLFLHRTAVEPGMTRPRYALESWFFAATDYPDGQVPLVW